MSWNDDLRSARRRALRAAQVVTLGFALAGGTTACSSRDHVGPIDDEDSGTMGDGSIAIDSGPTDDDSGMERADSGPIDEDSGMTITDAGDAGDAGDGGLLADAGPDAATDGGSGTDGCIAMSPEHDCVCGPLGPDDPDCCEGVWIPGGGCAVPGPFVPPSMTA
jgi:hypothetical protein